MKYSNYRFESHCSVPPSPRSALRTTLVLVLLLISFIAGFLPARAQTCPAPPAPTDANWFGITSNSGGPLADDGPMVSTMSANGNVYIAGVEGSVIKVAWWDIATNHWEILGKYLYLDGSSFPIVNTITVAANGDVYIGGTFDRALNSSSNLPIVTPNTARWDFASSQWGAVGQGTSDFVSALCADDQTNRVYIGRATTGFNPDGTPVTLNGAGWWDIATQTWQPMGQGITLNSNVTDLAVDNTGDVYICGFFDTAFDPGGTPISVNGVARWDGSNWHALGQGLDPSPYYPYGIAFDSQGNLYLGGRFDWAKNGNGSMVAGPVVRWDGSQWSSLGHPDVFNLWSLAIDHDDNAYAAWIDPNFNGPYVSRWNTSQWDTLADFPLVEGVATLAANPDYIAGGNDLYAGGLFWSVRNLLNNAEYLIQNNARWNGAAWHRMIGRGDANGTVFAFDYEAHGPNPGYTERLYVGGDFNNIAGVSTSNIAAFDATASTGIWQAVGGGVNAPVHAISADMFVNVAVGGEFTKAVNTNGDTVIVNHIAIWSPTTEAWLPVGKGVDGPVYAVYNGRNWNSISGDYGYLIVGGAFTTAENSDGSTVTVNGIARWDFGDQLWESYGSGVEGGSREVRTLATQGFSTYDPYPTFFIGGSFDAALDSIGNPISSSNIIRWREDGPIGWEPVGQGVNDVVYALATQGYGAVSEETYLWAGGELTMSTNGNGNSINTPHISLWDVNTSQWLPVRGGLDSAVYAIEPSNRYRRMPTMVARDVEPGVFIGGDFTLGLYQNGNSRQLNHVGFASLTNSQTWVPMAQIGIDDRVNALITIGFCHGAGQNVFAGGEFETAGVRFAKGLARWRYHYHPCYSALSAKGSGSGSGGGIGVATSGPPCTPLTRALSLQEIAIDSLGFRESAHIDSLQLYQFIDLSIFPEGNPGNPLVTLDSLMIESYDPGTLVFMGVDDTTLYAPNPEGRSTALTALINNFQAEVMQSGDVQLVFVNAVTDAPTVDIVVQGTTVVDSLPYGEAAERVGLSPGSYTFDIIRRSDGQILDSYPADISGYADQVVTMLLSGFLDPNANQNGPAMSLDPFETGVNTTVVGVDTEVGNPNIAEKFRLSQNYPNPFNPETTIEFYVPHGFIGPVKVRIYNVLGQQVKTLINQNLPPGDHEVIWRGSNEQGVKVASGLYFYGLLTNRLSEFKKMILLK